MEPGVLQMIARGRVVYGWNFVGEPLRHVLLDVIFSYLIRAPLISLTGEKECQSYFNAF